MIVWNRCFSFRTLNFLGFLILLINCSMAQNCSGSISLQEFDSLWFIFNSTHGDNWRWHSNESLTRWNFSLGVDSPCSIPWQGISCTRLQGACAITGLTLTHYNMSGTLPPQIDGLSLLVTLDLRFNHISGRSTS